MKSNEFIEEEIIDEWSITNPGIKKELEKMGYKLLGKGVDQMAFLEPGTGYVLKIFGTQHGLAGKPNAFSADQKMFFKFADYCMKHQDNPFLPKFFGYESFVYDNKNYLQIQQEKLSPSGNLGREMNWIGHDIYDSVAYYPEKKQEIVNDAIQSAARIVGAEKAKLLVKTLLDLVHMGEDNGWSWDLHDLNILRRGKTPVIVDPWVAS